MGGAALVVQEKQKPSITFHETSPIRDLKMYDEG
jgi:hypothetical protein